MDIEAAPNPTSFLPPLLGLPSHSTQNISYAIKKLESLYWPPKPPPLPATITLSKRTIARLNHDHSAPDSGYASAEEDLEGEDTSEDIVHIAADTEDSDQLEVLRADTFQREFAIKWITGFISRSGTWIDLATSNDDQTARSCLLDDATGILSGFVGGKDEGHDEEQAVLRNFSFPTPDGGAIAVELRDAPLLDDDHTSVGLQSWGSCICLSKCLCATPAVFSLSPATDPEHPYALRVLELGAGTGLLSIVAAKLLSRSSYQPTIIATDYHPDVLINLAANITSNFPSSTLALPISVHELDWEKPVYSPPFDVPFDIILAADVIYHPNHARWIKGSVEQLLKRPSPTDHSGGVFWMVIALRSVGRHEGLDESVVTMFGEKLDDDGGLTLAILETQHMERLEGVGRADESGYRLFKIGWKVCV